MVDIEALHLLRQRCEALDNLPNPADISFEKYEEIVSRTMTKTQADIEKVSKYATEIIEELENVRELVKNCSVKIDEQMSLLMNEDSFAKPGQKATNLKRIDIKALHLLRLRREALVSLPNPDDPNISFEKYEEPVSRTMKKTQTDVEIVTKYATEIIEELENVRQLVRNHSVKISEQISSLMNEVRWAKLGQKAPTLTRKTIDMKRQENVKNLQRLKKQQQILMEFIENNEELILKLEEEEQKKKDWKNWPPFIYYNTQQNKFSQDICCVIFTMPDGTQETDFDCQCSDAVEDLDNCLETNDEQLVSPIITIQSKKGEMTFELPMRVYVPIVSHDQSLLSTLKLSIKGQKWRSGISLPDIQLPKIQGVAFVGVEIPTHQMDKIQCVAVARHKLHEIEGAFGGKTAVATKGVAFVGVEIPTNQMDKIQCVAVARHKPHEIEVDVEGTVLEPAFDRNVKIKFPQGAFGGKTTVATKELLWTHAELKKASEKHKELQNIKPAGSCIEIACENSTKKDSDLAMYDFGCFVDKTIRIKQSVNQETLNRCSRWFVNNLNPDENALQFKDVFGSEFMEVLKTKETDGDKNRLILRHVHDVDSDVDFDNFLVEMISSQPNVSHKLNSVKSQVKLSRKTENNDFEDKFACEFDPDFVKKEGTIRVVSKFSGKSWEVVPIEASAEHQTRHLKLPSGNDNYQILGLVVPYNISNEDVCKAAEILEELSCVTNVSIICRQKHSDPHEVIIECVKSENVENTLQHLDSIGYNDGPAESAEFDVIDGEEIEIKFESNLYLKRLKRSLLKIKFYKHLQCNRYSEYLEVVSNEDQGPDINYHGYLKYSVPPGRLSLTRTGSLVVYVPKPLEDMVRNFPYTLDVPVKALAKFIAWQLTCTIFISTKWVKLGRYLTGGNTHLFHHICKTIDKKATTAPQRERCEHFILYWANHHASEESDKVEKIIKSHHDPNMESDAHQFIKPYLPGKGIFSNDSLEKMAFAIAGEWESMAKKLGFTNEEINEIKNNQPLAVRQTLRMLDIWRLSDSAIQKVTDLVKNFLETAQCGAKLLTIISRNIN
ncbi:Hypothetical predicted protein [Mytilus galloprovincialis]|uniref:Death domain-containing protein n=1 Tax=Mytilus galloprovincialis TaxID=29158 RepID=A0A8B6DRV8_MYTGA|nr:Hypothetical predicted protein [Mytilus galloprovincialis]